MKIAVFAAACAASLVLAAGAALAGDEKVIVGFKTGADARIVEKHGGKADLVLSGLKAVAARVPASAISDLRAESDVAYVEEDGIVEILGQVDDEAKGGGKPAPSPPDEVAQWGVQRVGGPGSVYTGSGIKVAIIDTGIDLDHDDLKANVKTGANFVNSSADPDDDNGHGSHVAGIVAAADNTIGVVGVAPQAFLYPVKVLDRRGSGTWSAVAAGVDWAADNGMNIANMSLGGTSNSSTLETACGNAKQARVLIIVAAGNNGDGKTSTTETFYPAAYDSVVAVGATDSSDNLASFSNTGSFVDVSAPGVSNYSTYKGNTYKTLSGTSMASPHAAGVAALIWSEVSTRTRSDVETELLNRAVDPYDSQKNDPLDNGYGNGIVHF